MDEIKRQELIHHISILMNMENGSQTMKYARNIAYYYDEINAVLYIIGTNDLTDALLDAAVSVENDGVSKRHQGFVIAADVLRHNLVEDGIIEKGVELIVGHSFGAAIAANISYENGFKSLGFGLPPTGDENFHHQIHKHTEFYATSTDLVSKMLQLINSTYRFVRGRDIPYIRGPLIKLTYSAHWYTKFKDRIVGGHRLATYLKALSK